jgi:predicted dehydrogenase
MKSKIINIGVIGCGYWGPNLIRNINNSNSANLVWVCDLNSDRLDAITKQYPHVKKTSDFNELLSDDQLDAVVIATPVHSHHFIALECLRYGKHVLLEKPIANSAEEAEELIAIAKENSLTLMCDHTYCYSSPVKKIRELIKNNTLGDILYFDSVRINLGLFQQDINVAWDLAPHDLSILFSIFDEYPLSLSATGACHSGNKIENISYINLYYPNNMIAHLHVNWLSPLKERKIMIAGDKKMLVWDDLNQNEVIKIYDTGIGVEKVSDAEKRKFMISYRYGDIFIPKLNSSEPLSLVVDEFVNSITENRRPATDGVDGLNVLKVLEAINFSMKNNSQEVILNFKTN